jgi:uncharacterized membrane protein YphA (DoxX/SURF4 family)
MAVIAEAVWLGWAVRRADASLLVYPGLVTFLFLALALARGRWPWLASLARVFVGFAFTASVADRFGLLGPPGAAGVSWGDFPHFVVYTRQVNGFLPEGLAPTLAVLATLLEAALGLALIVGGAIRLAASAAAVLLLLFGSAMAISLGFVSTFPYAVFVLAGGAWVLTHIDASRLSVDALLRRRRTART